MAQMESDPKATSERADWASNAIPTAEMVREELVRVLSSRTFRSAEGQKKFLGYSVEQTIDGRSLEVKEYAIGVAVFDRGPLFDQRLDNIVRAEARKLRVRLAKYYDSEGEHDPVRIEFPARGYVPTFRYAGVPVPGLGSSASEGAPPKMDQSASQSSDPAGIESLLSPPGDWRQADSRHTGSHQTKAEPAARAPRAYFAARWLGVGVVAALLIFAFVRLAGFSSRPPAESLSIVVLPFQNLGDNKDESFSDGLTDELIDDLGRVQGLHVVARTSAFQFRGKTLDVRQIGRLLNARTVLEGSVRVYANRLRITAELDDTTNGFRVWSNSYDRDFSDALFLQRDITQAIVGALREEFASSRSPYDLKFPAGKPVAVNAETYQDYLRGVYFWNKQTSESIDTAVHYFERVIAKDPGYASAYVGLARCYINIPAFTRTRAREVAPKISRLARKALELDSSLVEPHIELAYASALTYDWAAAERQFKKGLELGPGDAVAHRLYGIYLLNTGRLEKALAESQTAQQLDPVSPYMSDGTTLVLYMMRRYDGAIEQAKKTLVLDPGFGYAHRVLGAAYLQKQMYRNGIAELQLACAQMKNSSSPPATLAYAYAISGNVSQARRMLREFLEKPAGDTVPPKTIADVYVGLGDEDQALAWLGKAVDAQDVNLFLLADPIYDPLRSDPRFNQLLRRAKLRPQVF